MHKLRHTEGGGGVSASVMMYTLSIRQYGIMCNKGEGGVHNGQKSCDIIYERPPSNVTTYQPKDIQCAYGGTHVEKTYIMAWRIM